jgi:hypothetical protein
MLILRSEGGENPGSIRSEHVGRGGLLGRSVGNTKTRGSTGCQILASQTRVAFACMGEIDETVLPNLTAEDLIAKINIIFNCCNAHSTSDMGQSRPGRARAKSGHVRYAAESGSKFRALATQRRAIAG